MPAPSDISDTIVIGSGPAGVACASALLSAGRGVLLIDAGLELEQDRLTVVDRLKTTSPDQWSREDTDFLQGSPKEDESGLVDKLHFGSDYAYRDADALLHLQRNGVGIKASLARGGLSTVWGSAMMPATDHDTSTWPLRYSDLERHYKAVSGFIPFSGCPDDLSHEFPLGSDNPLDLQPSRQAVYLLQRMAAKKQRLQAAGLHVGRSRVAIKGQGDDEEGCVYCGFCMYGCPYGYIYNSASSLPALRKTGQFQEETNCIVTHLVPQGATVTVQGFHRVTRKPFTMRASRVFLAGGALSTTKLLMQTLGLYDQDVPMLDSQYFVLPALLGKRMPAVESEQLHGMSQLFMELRDPRITANTIHMQLYTYSSFLGSFVERSFGLLARPLTPVIDEVNARLSVIQGFLHSNDSGHMLARLRRMESGESEMTVAPRRSPGTFATIARVVARLCRQSFNLGMLPVLPQLQIPPVGRSFHTGGSFPMAIRPEGLATDLLGRPPTLTRIHAVDATILPSIPATTITFPVMANAHRIGTEAAKLD